jgi:hypothetical protein
MMTALLCGHEALDRVERARGSLGVDEVDEHRTGDRDRTEGDEHGDGDRLVGSVEPRLGDRRGRGEGRPTGNVLARHRDRRHRQRHASEIRELLRGLAQGYCFAFAGRAATRTA